MTPTLLALLACGGTPDPDAQPPSVEPWTDATCVRLFGQPGENTGLDEDECAPIIQTAAGRTWTPKTWAQDDLDDLGRRTLTNPSSPLGTDPYADPNAYPLQEDAVCGIETDTEDSYRLETFADETAARDAGAVITHGGACGACSSLADLAVYAGTPDLTTPVRSCALAGLGGDGEATVACLQDVGFTEACAEIWYYNTANTRDACLDVCLSALDEPYHTEDGSPNDCIACDEEMSGPVFKAVAGRTRRNSGLATALCRPCETVWRIDHAYP